MNKISMIVPIYQTEKYIGNFIKSVINQTFKEFELILVNDGTKDNAIEVAENLLKNTKIEYKVINKENGGQSTARNAGLMASACDWIVFPDSDDVLQKDYLKILYDNTIDDIDIVICDLNNVNDSNVFEESKRTELKEEKTGKEFFIDFIMHNIAIGPCSLIIKKSIIEELNLKFNESSKYSEEFIFITTLLYNSNRVIHVKERIYNYCLRKGSVSTGANIDKIINGYNEIIKSSETYLKSNDKSDIIYQKFAIPRWILATARFTASNMEYHDYKELMIKLNAKKEILRLFVFPSFKIKISSLIFYLSIRLFYVIFRI